MLKRIDAGAPYVKAVASLSPDAKKAGTALQQDVVVSASVLWKTESR